MRELEVPRDELDAADAVELSDHVAEYEELETHAPAAAAASNGRSGNSTNQIRVQPLPRYIVPALLDHIAEITHLLRPEQSPFIMGDAPLFVHRAKYPCDDRSLSFWPISALIFIPFVMPLIDDALDLPQAVHHVFRAGDRVYVSLAALVDLPLALVHLVHIRSVYSTLYFFWFLLRRARNSFLHQHVLGIASQKLLIILVLVLYLPLFLPGHASTTACKWMLATINGFSLTNSLILFLFNCSRLSSPVPNSTITPLRKPHLLLIPPFMFYDWLV